jgi:hypothetical protein
MIERSHAAPEGVTVRLLRVGNHRETIMKPFANLVSKRHLFSLGAVALVLILTGAPSFAASVTYNYTLASPFNTINLAEPSLLPVVNTSNFITASVTFNQALAANSTYTAADISSWTISEGITPITSALTNCSDYNLDGCALSFTTNGSAQISSWDFEVFYNPTVLNQHSLGTASGIFDYSTYNRLVGQITTENSGYTGVPTGVWVASPVPLPAAAWLLLSGLGGLGAMRRKRKAI